MPYTDSADLTKAPIPATGEAGESSEEASQVQALDAGVEGAMRGLANDDMNAVITGWTISAGTGLAVEVAAGKGIVRGIYSLSTTVIEVPSLPASQGTVYIYASHNTLPNGVKGTTFSASVSPVAPSAGMEIARCTTGTASVTSVQNDSEGRPLLAGWRSAPRIVSQASYSNQSAAVGSTNLTGTTDDGLYRFSYYIFSAVTGGAGTALVNASWNDGAARTVQSQSLLLATGGYVAGSIMLRNGTSSINFSTTVTGAVGTGRYSLDIICERMGTGS